jgi:hypothetical protein
MKSSQFSSKQEEAEPPGSRFQEYPENEKSGCNGYGGRSSERHPQPETENQRHHSLFICASLYLAIAAKSI